MRALIYYMLPIAFAAFRRSFQVTSRAVREIFTMQFYSSYDDLLFVTSS